MPYARTWSETRPAGGLAANQIDDEIRYLRVDLRERLANVLDVPDFTIDPFVAGTIAAEGLSHATQIEFVIGGTAKYNVTADGIIPETNNAVDIGTDALRVRTAYLATKLDSPALNHASGIALKIGDAAIFNLAGVALTPETDNAADLGTAAKNIREIHAREITSSADLTINNGWKVDSSGHLTGVDANRDINALRDITIDRHLRVKKQAYQDIYDAGNSGATPTIDFDNGGEQKLTLNNTVTAITLSNPKVGATYLLYLIQDATGSRTIAEAVWTAANVDFGTAGAPTLTTAANQIDIIVLKYYATNKYKAAVWGFGFDV